MRNIFFYSLSKYDNLEWDFRGHHQSFPPQISAALVIKITKAAAGKSVQERENELYLLLKTWISIGSAIEYR